MPKGPVAIALPADGPSEFQDQITLAGKTSNPYRLDLDDLPEYLESDDKQDASGAQPIQLPAMLNGRISKPGEADLWTFHTEQDATFEFDLRAARIGSRLDSVLTLLDATGKRLASSDDLVEGQTDRYRSKSRLAAPIPSELRTV